MEILSQRLRVPVEEGGLSMVHKRLRVRSAARRQAVLLIHGFAQNHHVWDLPERSFADHLAREGFDVFNLDMRGHGASRELGSRPALRFEHYVERDVPAALDVIASYGHARTFLVGHSLGGAVVYAAAPRERERVAGVVTLSGVFRWGSGTKTVGQLVRVLHRVDRVHRRLGLGRGLTIPLDVVGRYLGDRIGRSKLRLPLQGWIPGSIEDDVLQSWLQRSLDRSSGSVLALMGRWGATGRFCDTDGKCDYAADWAASQLPVLVIGADRDLLAHPIRDVKPAFDVATTDDRTYRCFGERGDSVGHVDLLIGKRAPDTVWPCVSQWMGRRLNPQTAHVQP